jgi:hypothetical protein
MQNLETGSSFRLPSAYVPLVMSCSAVVFMLVYVTIYGISQPGGDEGGPARLFQLTMLAQLPIIAWFAIRWLPLAPKQGLTVLVLQILAWATPVALIIYLESMG